jgi:hypothetical protein
MSIAIGLPMQVALIAPMACGSVRDSEPTASVGGTQVGAVRRLEHVEREATRVGFAVALGRLTPLHERRKKLFRVVLKSAPRDRFAVRLVLHELSESAHLRTEVGLVTGVATHPSFFHNEHANKCAMSAAIQIRRILRGH